MTIRESARAMRLRIESGDLLTLDEAVAACVTRDEALSVFELVENIPEEDAIRISCCGALASITDGIFGTKVECPRCHAKAVDATSPMWSPLLERGNSYYVHNAVDHKALGAWCLQRRGQLLVCENAGATWLPFSPFALLKAGVNGRGSQEVLFQQETT